MVNSGHVYLKGNSTFSWIENQWQNPGVNWSLPGGQSTKRAYSHSIFGSAPANVFKSYRQWAVAVQQIVGHHEGEGSRNSKVCDKADEQRGYNADRNGPLGILHLLTWDVGGEQAGLKSVTLLQQVLNFNRLWFFWVTTNFLKNLKDDEYMHF